VDVLTARGINDRGQIVANGINALGQEHALLLTPIAPTNKDQCKHGGWKNFGFKNQRECIKFVTTSN